MGLPEKTRPTLLPPRKFAFGIKPQQARLPLQSLSLQAQRVTSDPLKLWEAAESSSACSRKGELAGVKRSRDEMECKDGGSAEFAEEVEEITEVHQEETNLFSRFSATAPGFLSTHTSVAVPSYPKTAASSGGYVKQQLHVFSRKKT